MSEVYLESDDVRRGYITGRTFELKPVEYAVVEVEDPDGGESKKLAIFEGCIVLGTADEMGATSSMIEAAADAGAAGEESDEPSELALDYDSLAAAAAEGSDVQHGVGITGHGYRWPRGVVPYEIHPSLPNQARVTNAINHWHQKTRIRFVRRTSTNASRYPNYVRVIPSNGCWSQVGMRGGRQDLGLAPGCGTGSTIHEFAHAVGCWHEQSREDRNSFVRINWANITPGREHNFRQHITDGDDYGRYDYGSIMHYGRTAFSRNGQPTIVPLTAGVTIGQRTGLSANDIATIRAMYPNLQPTRTWMGVQFRGTVRAGQTQCWFTHSWP
ncbi:MAG: M12 family metallopeptidase, partial [Anaerolineaceae bacterium]